MNKRIIFAIVLMTATVGCATHQAVKTLSEEQVRVQEQYLLTLQDYFSLIERFMQSQIDVAEMQITWLTDELERKYKKQAQISIEDADSSLMITKALDKLTKNVLSGQERDIAALSRVKGYLQELRDKHAAMLDAYKIILAAQQKLNEYIQLEKADEVAVSALTSIVGGEKVKIAAIATSITKIYKELENYTKGAQQ